MGEERYLQGPVVVLSIEFTVSSFPDKASTVLEMFATKMMCYASNVLRWFCSATRSNRAQTESGQKLYRSLPENGTVRGAYVAKVSATQKSFAGEIALRRQEMSLWCKVVRLL